MIKAPGAFLATAMVLSTVAVAQAASLSVDAGVLQVFTMSVQPEHPEIDTTRPDDETGLHDRAEPDEEDGTGAPDATETDRTDLDAVREASDPDPGAESRELSDDGDDSGLEEDVSSSADRCASAGAAADCPPDTSPAGDT